MNFEMEFGWTGSEKIIVESHDFSKIKIIQEFIEYQIETDWVEYEDADELEVELEEDTEEEEVAE